MNKTFLKGTSTKISTYFNFSAYLQYTFKLASSLLVNKYYSKSNIFFLGISHVVSMKSSLVHPPKADVVFINLGYFQVYIYVSCFGCLCLFYSGTYP